MKTNIISILIFLTFFIGLFISDKPELISYCRMGSSFMLGFILSRINKEDTKYIRIRRTKPYISIINK